MSAEQFPLCKAAGLSVQSQPVYKYSAMAERGDGPSYSGETSVVLAADVERWLEQAPVVHGVSDGSIHTELHFPWTGESRPQDTHTARLVCIQPIVRDTAEGLLRELIADHEALLRADASRKEWPLVTRARKLLGQEGE